MYSLIWQCIKKIRYQRCCVRAGLAYASGSFVICATSKTPCQTNKTCLEGSVVWGYVIKVYKRLRFCTKVLLKVVQLVCILIPASIVFLASKLSLISRERMLRTMRAGLVYAGPCWVKLGQWAATRPDLFSRDCCETMSSLHSFVYSHSWSSSAEILRRQLPGDYQTWLLVDKTPVNTGAVAQVYRGVLKRNDGTGDSVAIKILHPNIRENVNVDLCLLRLGASFLELFPKVGWLAPTQAVRNFSQTMLKQLDLTVEHANLHKFRANFSPESGVIFPLPFLSTPDILIESFEESVVLSEAVSTGSVEANKRLARAGIRMFLKMVFEDNFIHGDLHPGNMLVSRDHSKLVVLDAGMTISLQPEQQRMLYPLIKSFVSQDYTDVCRRLLHDAPVNDCLDPELFVAEMSDFVGTVATTRLRLGDLDVSNMILDFFKLLTQHKVQLEAGFASTIIAVLVLEGVGRSLDPTLDILKEAAPFLLAGF